MQLSSKLQVVKEKTSQMKKGLSKKKNRLAAMRKEQVAKNLLPPQELTQFLQSDEVFDKLLMKTHGVCL